LVLTADHFANVFMVPVRDQSSVHLQHNRSIKNTPIHL